MTHLELVLGPDTIVRILLSSSGRASGLRYATLEVVPESRHTHTVHSIHPGACLHGWVSYIKIVYTPVNEATNTLSFTMTSEPVYTSTLTKNCMGHLLYEIQVIICIMYVCYCHVPLGKVV